MNKSYILTFMILTEVYLRLRLSTTSQRSAF